MRLCRQQYKGRDGKTRESAKWYAEIKDHDGRAATDSRLHGQRGDRRAGPTSRKTGRAPFGQTAPDSGTFGIESKCSGQKVRTNWMRTPSEEVESETAVDLR